MFREVSRAGPNGPVPTITSATIKTAATHQARSVGVKTNKESIASTFRSLYLAEGPPRHDDHSAAESEPNLGSEWS
jgi:hypothetical protein